MFIHTQTRALFVGVAFSAIRGPNSTLHTHTSIEAHWRAFVTQISLMVFTYRQVKNAEGEIPLCCVRVVSTCKRFMAQFKLDK